MFAARTGMTSGYGDVLVLALAAAPLVVALLIGLALLAGRRARRRGSADAAADRDTGRPDRRSPDDPPTLPG